MCGRLRGYRRVHGCILNSICMNAYIELYQYFHLYSTHILLSDDLMHAIAASTRGHPSSPRHKRNQTSQSCRAHGTLHDPHFRNLCLHDCKLGYTTQKLDATSVDPGIVLIHFFNLLRVLIFMISQCVADGDMMIIIARHC